MFFIKKTYVKGLRGIHSDQGHKNKVQQSPHPFLLLYPPQLFPREKLQPVLEQEQVAIQRMVLALLKEGAKAKEENTTRDKGNKAKLPLRPPCLKTVVAAWRRRKS